MFEIGNNENKMFEIESVEKTNENLGKVNVTKKAFKKSLKIDNRDDYTEKEIKSALPNINEVTLIKTNGLSDVSSIFKTICKYHRPDEVYVATWVINRNNIDYLIDLKCNVKKMVISNRLKSLKRNDYNYLLSRFAEIEDENKRLRICNTHAKTFSIKSGSNFFTIIGSGNWTENPRIETYIIHNDFEIFNFNKEWITELTK